MNARNLAMVFNNQPDLSILKISNVTAIGGTLGVYINKLFFHPELAKNTNLYDNKRPSIYNYQSDYNSCFDVKINIHKKQRKQIKVALHLLKEHSSNYYHWMFECIPRLIYFIKHNPHKLTFITLLIDKNVPKQCIEMLHYAMQEYKISYEIIYIELGHAIICDSLYYVTPFWYSFDNTRNLPNVYKDFLVDQQAISLVRSSLNINHTPNNHLNNIAPSKHRKIYLTRRNALGRNIINQNDVELMIMDLGFEIIETRSMSFLEQKELFSNASIVVGPTGASFANIIFMPEQSSVIILSPNNRFLNYYIFQQIADVANLNLAHFLGEKSCSRYVHDDFSVNCQKLKKLILKKYQGVCVVPKQMEIN